MKSLDDWILLRWHVVWSVSTSETRLRSPSSKWYYNTYHHHPHLHQQTPSQEFVLNSYFLVFWSGIFEVWIWVYSVSSPVSAERHGISFPSGRVLPPVTFLHSRTYHFRLSSGNLSDRSGGHGRVLLGSGETRFSLSWLFPVVGGWSRSPGLSLLDTKERFLSPCLHLFGRFLTYFSG